MAIKVKRTGAWVTIPNGSLFVKRSGVWVSPVKVWVKRSGAWVDTGFTGRPNTPTLAIYSDDYTHIQVSVVSPSGGTPTATVRTALYNSGGGLVAGPYDQAATPGSTVYRNFTGLTADTSYIIRAWTLSAAGAISLVTPDLRRRTGHAEQGYNRANYGYGAINYGAVPAQIDGTSAHEDGTHPGSYSVDVNYGTAWVSGPRAAGGGGDYWEGLRFEGNSGQRQLSEVHVDVGATTYGYQQEVWLSIFWNGAWQGGYSPPSMNMTGGAPALLYHNYLLPSYGNVTSRVFNVDGYAFTNGVQFDLACTNLEPWPLAFRGSLSEVNYAYRDWVVVSYTWIVTVSAAGNTYW